MCYVITRNTKYGGHLASRCNQPIVCSRCGMRGHSDRDCGTREVTMMAREKLRDQKGGNVCHKCGSKGHVAHECTWKGPGCSLCGKQGHRIAQCPRNGGTAGALIESRHREATLFAHARYHLESKKRAEPTAELKFDPVLGSISVAAPPTVSLDDWVKTSGRGGEPAHRTVATLPSKKQGTGEPAGTKVPIVKPKSNDIKIPASQLCPRRASDDPQSHFAASDVSESATGEDPAPKKQRVAAITVGAKDGKAGSPHDTPETEMGRLLGAEYDSDVSEASEFDPYA
ncbi:hypothetical protein CYMTET_43699 [Cymbomonas tetramitiformis]|uniref:CCHC-type domain-containing protein n=1 Tax=Cymbomonas tetramitiformis TaxID=36881 RepID=A0AAE0F0A3_9CHLO|nr:hypothetical protein CYMTET_43699 [Cymbomonas tetramitiformis]